MLSRGSVITVLLILLLAVVSPGCVEEDDSPRYNVSLFMSVEASGLAEIYLPIPDYQPLVDRLEVTRGEGGFELVDTPYGRCMMVSFDTLLQIDNEYRPSDPDEIAAMTANLTTLDPEVANQTGRFFWYNVSSGTVTDVDIFISINENNFATTFSYHSKIINDGWYRYEIKYSYGEVFAP